MSYTTPTYNYETASAASTAAKGQADVARNYGRFLGQERFRRAGEDQDRSFQDNMPKVGTHFNRRGMWDSGLRRRGQRQFAQDYQRDRGRLQFDQGAEETGYDLQQGTADANYELEQLALIEQLAAARAAGYDPFAAVRGVV